MRGCLTFRLSQFLLLLLLSVAASAAAAEPLTVSYFERPPYYYTTENGAAAGILLDRTRQVMRKAGLDIRLVTMAPYRILYVLQHATVPHCSVGWFKNEERELYAKFSKPIYRNQSLVVLTSKVQRGKFSSQETLRELFADRSLTMARMAEFSYGEVVDKLLGELSPNSIFLTGEQSTLLQAIAENKATYMLVAPEEVGMLTRLIGLPVEDFVSIKLTDLPSGNLRYLMCNQAVPDETLQQLNRSIQLFYQEWGMEK